MHRENDPHGAARDNASEINHLICFREFGDTYLVQDMALRVFQSDKLQFEARVNYLGELGVIHSSR
jgi:hypothetical protein